MLRLLESPLEPIVRYKELWLNDELGSSVPTTQLR